MLAQGPDSELASLLSDWRVMHCRSTGLVSNVLIDECCFTARPAGSAAKLQHGPLGLILATYQLKYSDEFLRGDVLRTQHAHSGKEEILLQSYI